MSERTPSCIRCAGLLALTGFLAWLFRTLVAMPTTGSATRDGAGDTLETIAAVGFIVCVIEWWRDVRDS